MVPGLEFLGLSSICSLPLACSDISLLIFQPARWLPREASETPEPLASSGRVLQVRLTSLGAKGERLLMPLWATGIAELLVFHPVVGPPS